ncbi:unnamed protein product [Caenorhabditis bovis]|uniref:Uncharacterized protein n=1 Tax=Caenorhabditis bovis TaxID=2654633 RepID=A0A8S1EBX7_9PELO|nr:unnamed protein product [Caenorhabditis bovis]
MQRVHGSQKDLATAASSRHPLFLHISNLPNVMKRSNTVSTQRPSSRNTMHSPPQLFVSLGETVPRQEKRVSFKDAELNHNRPLSCASSPLPPNRKVGYHNRKLHRCDTGDMALLERYLSRESLYDPFDSPSRSSQALTGTRRQIRREQDAAPNIRKRLSRSCDHLNEHNFSPRLPPIRRRPTKHVPTLQHLNRHG